MVKYDTWQKAVLQRIEAEAAKHDEPKAFIEAAAFGARAFHEVQTLRAELLNELNTLKRPVAIKEERDGLHNLFGLL